MELFVFNLIVDDLPKQNQIDNMQDIYIENGMVILGSNKEPEIECPPAKTRSYIPKIKENIEEIIKQNNKKSKTLLSFEEKIASMKTAITTEAGWKGLAKNIKLNKDKNAKKDCIKIFKHISKNSFAKGKMLEEMLLLAKLKTTLEYYLKIA